MLINQANDIYKSRSKVIYLHDISDEPQHEDSYDLGNEVIAAAVADLSLELRTVITLYYFQDMRIKEIAGVLEIPQGTVKWRLSKAKEKLKEKLSEAPPPETKEGIGRCKAI